MVMEKQKKIEKLNDWLVQLKKRKVELLTRSKS